MLGVPEVNERLRPVQQRVDQGEDLHSAEKTSRQILKECLSMCLSVDNKATKYINECPSFNPCTYTSMKWQCAICISVLRAFRSFFQ